MPKVSVYNLEGQAVGEIELSDAVFGAPVNEALLHQAVVMYLDNQRQGTASTKTRGGGPGRRPQAVAPKGHRPGPARQHPLAHLGRRRRRVWPEAP